MTEEQFGQALLQLLIAELAWVVSMDLWVTIHLLWPDFTLSAVLKGLIDAQP